MLARRRKYKIKGLKVEGDDCGALPCWGKFSGLLRLEKDNLELAVSNEEVWLQVFRMASLKAPRVDEFHAKFYQAQWDVVGPLGPDMITQFRPISLCTFLYHIATKTIVNRLRPLIIKVTKQNQDSFVMGRNCWKTSGDPNHGSMSEERIGVK
ncbi:hypothetical protein V6Z12_D13G196600 [Gossypium hirsutum]